MKERIARAWRRYDYAEFLGLPLRICIKAWWYGFLGRGTWEMKVGFYHGDIDAVYYYRIYGLGYCRRLYE